MTLFVYGHYCSPRPLAPRSENGHITNQLHCISSSTLAGYMVADFRSDEAYRTAWSRLKPRAGYDPDLQTRVRRLVDALADRHPKLTAAEIAAMIVKMFNSPADDS
jgi:hypothetical protein